MLRSLRLEFIKEPSILIKLTKIKKNTLPVLGWPIYQNLRFTMIHKMLSRILANEIKFD